MPKGNGSKMPNVVEYAEEAEGKVTLSRKDIEIIHLVLLTGLDAHGELERLADEYKTLRDCKVDLPQELQPSRAGGFDTVGHFAHALTVVAVSSLRLNYEYAGNWVAPESH